MSSTTAQSTIEILIHVFVTYGSDNGPQFIAAEFAEFLQENGVKYTHSSLYHPASNGQAERFVKSFKQAMKAVAPQAHSIHQKLENFALLSIYSTCNHGLNSSLTLFTEGTSHKARLITSSMWKPSA